MAGFGSRFSELFEGKKQKEIAEILGVTDGAVRNYLGGRVPDDEKLRRIAEVTGCNLHWLITGTGDKYVEKSERVVRNDESFDRLLEERIRELIREELKTSTPVQDLGTVDEFDVLRVVERHRDPQSIMREVYAREGRDYPEDFGVTFFQGWESFTLEQKVDAVHDAKKALDKTLSKGTKKR